MVSHSKWTVAHQREKYIGCTKMLQVNAMHYKNKQRCDGLGEIFEEETGGMMHKTGTCNPYI